MDDYDYDYDYNDEYYEENEQIQALNSSDQVNSPATQSHQYLDSIEIESEHQ